MQYKTVAGPVGLTISRKESYEEAVRSYAAIIDREAVGGWKLKCIQEIPVTKNKGCFAALFSIIGLTTAYEHMTFNMLVSEKEDSADGYGYGYGYANVNQQQNPGYY